ncbi:hypothetical protein VMCG_08337 [Cytospora schulzeri]|uniref:Luciferase domain-containing protein n=1 Tax=Cytospora schulzeri TaxID=448051 RepID=A0A423VVB9_9PEZI|nr:hypothetical protein VMCG_08337 [Valsa malicola]
MATNTFSSLAGHLRSHNINIPIPTTPQTLLQNPKLAATIALTISLSIPALSYAARSYRGYLALGPGGIPHNVLGWSIQGLLQLVARWDTRDPAPFAEAGNQRAYEPYGTTSFLELEGLDLGVVEEGVTGEGKGTKGKMELPQRRGDRPDVPGYVAPQRQTTQQGTADMRDRMAAYLEDLAARNPGLLTLKPSGLEGAGGPLALWLDGTSTGTGTGTGDNGNGNGNGNDSSDNVHVQIPPYLRPIRGEIAHVHPEASSHVTVSMADAGGLVRRGWAERHRLSGVFGVLPWGYVMLYAPRDEAELGVWRGVVAAGVRFVCAGTGRGVVVV